MRSKILISIGFMIVFLLISPLLVIHNSLAQNNGLTGLDTITNYSNQSNHTEAMEFYDRALALDPYDTDVLTNKGLLFYDMGNYTEAINYYDQVLAIDPNNTFASDNKQALLDYFEN